MSTNTPAKQPQIKTLALTTTEQTFTFPSSVSIIDIVMEIVTVDAAACYVAVVPGGTNNADLRWTLLGPTANKKADQLHLRDINWVPEEGLYVRASANTPLLQVWYWS